VVKVENGHRGISNFSRAPSPYLRAPRNSTGPLIIFSRAPSPYLRAPTNLTGPLISLTGPIFYTQNPLFPFRAQLATGGGCKSKFFTPKSVFFRLVQNSRPGGGGSKFFAKFFFIHNTICMDSTYLLFKHFYM